MITIRKSDQRGHFNFGWLDTKHTFSFGDYFDKNQMGFRGLRVINEDVVAPGQGFGRHPHQDMEIITYVLSGALAHQDWVNGKATHAESLTPGEVQHMSAGYGIEHSEFNASQTDPVHLLQIWIRPTSRGQKPTYDQKRFDTLAPGATGLTLVASPDGAARSIAINSDTKLYVARAAAGKQLEVPIAQGRHAWVQVTRGELSVNGNRLTAGDGAAASEEGVLTLENTGASETEALVFDLA